MPTTSSALVVAGIDVATAPSILENGSHSHGLLTEVGYVVRQTQRDGVWLCERGDGNGLDNCGFDVAVAEKYTAALDVMHALRVQEGNWAVIDRVYGCGCRS
jgi:hypothetical protein